MGDPEQKLGARPSSNDNTLFIGNLNKSWTKVKYSNWCQYCGQHLWIVADFSLKPISSAISYCIVNSGPKNHGFVVIFYFRASFRQNSNRLSCTVSPFLLTPCAKSVWRVACYGLVVMAWCHFCRGILCYLTLLCSWYCFDGMVSCHFAMFHLLHPVSSCHVVVSSHVVVPFLWLGVPEQYKSLSG